VVKLPIEIVVPLDGVVGVNDLNPTAVLLDYISNVVE
jgi:hypothetical protein